MRRATLIGQHQTKRCSPSSMISSGQLEPTFMAVAMYETMVGWETDEFSGDRHPVMVDFAEIWRAADKVVFSRVLESVSSARTRIEATFAPQMIQKMKHS